MIYCFDIDNTICATDEGDYKSSIPGKDQIAIINDLYERGNTIILHTARNKNFTELTKNQLDRWAVKYHTLILGKPFADLYIDDRAINSQEFFTKLEEMKNNG